MLLESNIFGVSLQEYFVFLCNNVLYFWVNYKNFKKEWCETQQMYQNVWREEKCTNQMKIAHQTFQWTAI